MRKLLRDISENSIELTFIYAYSKINQSMSNFRNYMLHNNLV